jgi:predicted nucleic-acid-binding protein
VIFGLDTSVLIRVLSGDPEELALAALGFLFDRRESGDRVRVSELVVAESYYALQHHYGASKRDALAALLQFLESPGIECDDGVVELLSTSGMESAKPGFVDRVIHRNYLRSGADRVATFERAAVTLPGAIVLPP